MESNESRELLGLPAESPVTAFDPNDEIRDAPVDAMPHK